MKEQGIVYFSDLWRKEEFLTKEDIESIMRYEMDNFDYINLKSFYTTKPNATKIRREAENWARTFATSVCDRRLISKMHRELSQMYKNTHHSPTEKWSKDMNRQLLR